MRTNPVGADLDPPALVPGGSMPFPQGAFGLRLRTGETHDDVYHGFLVLRIGLNPSRGRAVFYLKQKILTALLMGPSGSASPLRAAFRRIVALRARVSSWTRGSNTFDPYAGGCAAHGVL